MPNIMEKNYQGRKQVVRSSYDVSNDIPRMTDHAIRRTAQRNISEQAILATLHYGKKVHRTGRVFFVLRKKDVSKVPEIRSFAGTTLLLGRDGAIITAYSNEKSYKVIRKKSKRRKKQ